MEPPVVSSGPVLRRAATFSHRTERALKDCNGRAGLVNRSQENQGISKTSFNGDKALRAGKQYSAVASRYAAPLASKKALSTIGDGPHGGHSSVTKLPFITGRSAPQHKRRPSSDNLSLAQPPIVFAASARDAKLGPLVKKSNVPSNAVDAKRPKVVKKTSMVEKKPQVQARAPQLSSSDKGLCSCCKNGTVKGFVDTSGVGSASLLYSAAHWVLLIKLAKGENKHDVVIDLFRLSIRLKAEPREDIVGQLKRYQESHPGDEVVSQLVEQCENTQQEVCSINGEVIDKSVDEPDGDLLEVLPESKSSIAPSVVVEDEAAVKNDVPKKPPHLKGRMLSRSSTFSIVDADSRSQHAKADYGKSLAKTMDFLAQQDAAHSPSNTEIIDEVSHSEDEVAPGFVVGAKLLELASKIGSKLVGGPATSNGRSPVPESGSVVGNGSSEKPVGSLSEWLDGPSSETSTPDIESVPTQVTVDLSLKDTHASTNACDRNDESSADDLPGRRKSWQDAGGQSMTEIVENISRSHRHSVSLEATQLSVPGSVEEKIKLFTGLAELKGSTPEIAEQSGHSSATKECHGSEGVRAESNASCGMFNLDTVTETAVDVIAKTESVIDTPDEKECVLESSPKLSVATETASETLVDTNSGAVHIEPCKVPLATPLRKLTKQRSMKSDAATPVVPATPSSATSSAPASVGILRARHRRAMSVGNMTPRSPFEITGDSSPFGDSSSSRSGLSSSTKSKRGSRGQKDVTPRMDLPKPSWKSIVEREMKGSRLKDLLAAKLPEKTSPLAEYVQNKMVKQTRDLVSWSTGANEDGISTSSPANSVSKTMKSSSKKKPAIKELQQEGAIEPSTAKDRTLDEGEQEMDANAFGCSTPGSAVRRSARIQKKVHSRGNGLFKE